MARTSKQIGFRPTDEDYELLQQLAWAERTTVSKQALLLMVRGLRERVEERLKDKEREQAIAEIEAIAERAGLPRPTNLR